MADQAFRISEEKRVIVTPFDPRITNLIPHTKTLDKNGKVYNLTPHRHVESKLLKNLGYQVPSPILSSQYGWGLATPFESQKDTAVMLVENTRAYVLSELGTGKTLSSLFATDYLMQEGEVKCCLIVAPLSTLTNVWEQEIFRYFPHRTAVVLHGSKTKRQAKLAEGADFYIINPDGVGIVTKELIAKGEIDCIIIDELATYRNPRTSRWKAMNAVVKTKRYAWGMTGSPTPKAPTDAYGQIKLLTPDRVPRFFKAFQEETMVQITQFVWRERQDAKDRVYECMQPSVRFTRAQCSDLPPTTYKTYEVDMTKEQDTAYKDMVDKMQATLIGIKQSGEKVTSANAGVQLSKLLQIGAGLLYGTNPDGSRIIGEFDATPRMNCLKDIIDSTDQKVIVYAPFVHALTMLDRELGKHYPTAVIHGGVSKTQRDDIFNLFQNSTSPRVLIAHPKAIAHGLTLTAASTIVWYSPTFDLEIYEQANGRITRHGQKHNTLIANIQATPAEKKVYNTLKNRGNMLRSLLELFEV
jgi:SNF2 family DNA or RNA helicase